MLTKVTADLDLPEGWEVQWGLPAPWSGTIRKDKKPTDEVPWEIVNKIGAALLKNHYHVRYFKPPLLFYGSVQAPEQRTIVDDEFREMAREKVNDYDPTSPYAVLSDSSVELRPDGSARVAVWLDIEPPCPECGKETIGGDMTCPDGCEF